LIPKLLHFIWIGNEARRPDRLLATWARHHPDWTIKVWGNEDLQTPAWRNRQQIQELARSDLPAAAALMRWEILFEEGGLVFDIDSSCLSPLDPSVLDCEFFACWEEELLEPGRISARFVGSVPNNPFVRKLIAQIGADPDLSRRSSGDAVEGGLLTRMARAEQYAGLTIFPSHHFESHPSPAARPRFSIVIPTYNRRELLELAIASALAQVCPDFELIVVDDGSTDATSEFLASVADSRFRSIRQANAGVAAARNCGIRAALGDYIVWLDSDDQLLPDALARYSARVDDGSATDVMYGFLIYIDETGAETKRGRYEDLARVPAFPALFFSNRLPNPGTVVRRGLYGKVGLYDVSFTHCEDYEFWQRAAAAGARFACVNEFVCRYRWYEGNTSADQDRMRRGEAKVAEKGLREIPLQTLFPNLDWNQPDLARARASLFAAMVLMDRNALDSCAQTAGNAQRSVLAALGARQRDEQAVRMPACVPAGRTIDTPSGSDAAPALSDGCNLRVIVFSKDRPLQLHATVASLRTHCIDPQWMQVQVLALASDDAMKQRYKQVARELPFAAFVAENDFKRDLCEMVRGARHVAFVCDDALFVGPWSIERALRMLREIPNAIGVSLRLGRNTTYCYPQRQPQRIPPSADLLEGWCACDWTKADLDFAYPLELSSSVYRVQDVWALLTDLPYRTPNQLEEQLAARAATFAGRMPILVYPQASIAFCAPLNVVQSTHANRHGVRPSDTAQALAQRFDEGLRVDVEVLRGYTPRACHEEIELPLRDPAVGRCSAVSIPKVLHFIWLGDETQRPNQLLATWVRHHPDWTIKVWGNDDLSSPQWKNGHRMRDLAKSDPSGAAAILRWEILLAEGGLVFDIDSLCVRPLDEFLLDSEAFACWESELIEPGVICASFVGSVANNPFFQMIVDQIGADPELLCKPLRQAAGSDRLTRVWRSERYDGLTVFPSHYFKSGHPGAAAHDRSGRVYAIRTASPAATAQAQVEPVQVPAPARSDPPRGGSAGGGIMNVNFFCHIEKTGIGRHSESVLMGLLKARPDGMRVNYLDSTRHLSVWQLITNGRYGPDTTLFFWRLPPEFVRQVPGRTILWVVFESDRLPQPWVEQIRVHDQVWTPSEWCRDVLLAHGLEPERVRVVEEGVDESIFRPQPIEHPGFVFLSVGKYEMRKSIDETIEAFLDEFPAAREPSVQLWLKADYPGDPARAVRLREKLAIDPRIRVISDTLEDPELAKLYNSADAFVFPSKAEGFGLPCIEAIACGLPTIATDYSGQSVILKHIQGLFVPVDYRLVPIDDPDFCSFYRHDYGGGDFGRWAQPSVASLRKGMRHVFEEKALWRQRALQASEIIRSRLSWDRVTAKVVQELSAARRVPAPVTPVCPPRPMIRTPASRATGSGRKEKMAATGVTRR